MNACMASRSVCTINKLVPLYLSYSCVFQSKPVDMPAKRQGHSSMYTTRNQRRSRVRRSLKKTVEAQGLKIVRLEKTLTQLRKSPRLRKSVSTTGLIPDFQYDDVQQLPEGSVRPLLNHPAIGKIHSWRIMSKIHTIPIFPSLASSHS